MFTSQELVRRMQDSSQRTAEVINAYYTKCIPIYREFLGSHWHTGFYLADGPIGPVDQLRMERWIAELGEIDASCRVLDVGCGIGGPSIHLAISTGASVWGLTPNATQLSIAEDLAIQADVTKRVQFDLGFAERLPYSDRSFDVVVFFESVCHFPDRSAFLREAFRVLKSGGRLVGEDWIACENLSTEDRIRFIDPICQTWCIPRLGTRTEYVNDMKMAGFQSIQSVDLREKMPLHRGFAVRDSDRTAIQQDLHSTTDPIRQLVMEGLLHLGDGFTRNAFTVGQFKAQKMCEAESRRADS